MLVNKMEKEKNDIAQETSQTVKYIVIYDDTCSHEMNFCLILLQSSNSDSEMIGVILIQYMY